MATPTPSPSSVHEEFTQNAMGDKPVEKLPGIGDKLGEKLREHGFTKAYHVFGQFLVMDRDEKRFIAWLRKTGCEGRTACYKGLMEWNAKWFK